MIDRIFGVTPHYDSVTIATACLRHFTFITITNPLDYFSITQTHPQLLVIEFQSIAQRAYLFCMTKTHFKPDIHVDTIYARPLGFLSPSHQSSSHNGIPLRLDHHLNLLSHLSLLCLSSSFQLPFHRSGLDALGF